MISRLVLAVIIIRLTFPQNFQRKNIQQWNETLPDVDETM